MTSVMPKGVEHQQLQKMGQGLFSVMTSVMPKGVEHIAVADNSTVSCT